MNLKNHCLFSQTYTKELLQNPVHGDQDGAIFTTLKGWLADACFENRQTSMDTFIDPVLNAVGFALQPTDTGSGLLFDDYSFETPLAALIIVEPEDSLDETIKGSHWAQKLLQLTKQHRLKWGLLTNGPVWRLYNAKQTAPMEAFVEINLEEAIRSNDSAAFRAFLQFMTRDAFTAEPGLESHLQASAAAVGKIETHLQANVDEVLKRLCHGFIRDAKREQYSEEDRAEIFENAVYMLYRILFILYAESRQLLPVDQPGYSKYSLQGLVIKAADMHRGVIPAEDGSLWQDLLQLCTWIDVGHLGEGFEIASYNGGLFDNQTKPYLSQHKIPDVYMAEVLWTLGCIPGKNGKDYQMIDYRDLAVRHLGSLYEGILEYKLFIADEDMFIRSNPDGEVEYIPVREAGPKKKGDGDLAAGQVYFAQSQGARKASGSYYTREEIVAYNVKYAVLGGLNERWERFQPEITNYLSELELAINEEEQSRLQYFIDNEILKFVQQQVLRFRVCDPAMGSGHFLVNATYAITDFIVEKLNYTPWRNEHLDSDPVLWRRRVVENCIFGADINKLAVELAKLSLWITAAAAGKPLSFLDHHLKVGNSLAGVRLQELHTVPEKRGKKGKASGEGNGLFVSASLTHKLQETLGNYARIMAQDSDTIGIIHAKKRELQEAEAHVHSIRQLADIWMGFHFDFAFEPTAYAKIYDAVTRTGTLPDDLPENAALVMKQALQFGYRERFIHWEIEFPEVFAGGSGFDAMIGNPPWETWKPNSQEFFEPYIKGFRRLDKQKALIEIEKLLQGNHEIWTRWDQLNRYSAQYSDYFLNGNSFAFQTAVVDGKKTGSDLNLFKLFAEQFFRLLGVKGRCGIVIPSGVYTDMGATGLRRMLFGQTTVHSMYCFENYRHIFFRGVDTRTKFVVLTYRKENSTVGFRGAFYLHDPDLLETLDETSLHISVALVQTLASDTWSVLEFNSQRDIDIVRQMYQFPTLGETVPGKWELRFTAEFHMTNDSHFFNTAGRGAVLYEGKMIHQYTHTFAEPNSWVDEKGIEHLVDKEIKRVQNTLVDRFAPLAKGTKEKIVKQLLATQRKKDCLDRDDIRLGCETYRIAYRDIAASTNERALIASILPPGIVCGNKCPVQIPLRTKEDINKQMLAGESLSSLLYEKTMTPKEQCFAAGILNSFLLDFIIRKKITTTLNMFYMYQLPVPRYSDGDPYFAEIAERSARLICSEPRFAELAAEVGVPVETLAPEKRQELQNEIDAYAAKIYGFNVDDLAYVLAAFPLVKQEIKDGVLAAFARLGDAT